MAEKKQEPWAVRSMDELLATARVMEREAIEGYRRLAQRMRDANQPDLALLFDELVREEQGHLGQIEDWLDSDRSLDAQVSQSLPPMFDDEDAALIAPELLDAYRAFSMAVRNEERAFVFWTYVAAHAASEDIRMAAERMAREELGHIATLRRERRRAFHDIRSRRADSAPLDLATLEQRLADHLERAAGQAQAAEQEHLKTQSGKARARSVVARAYAAGKPLPLASPPEALVPLCEYLLDYYLDLSERERDEEAQHYAQSCSADLVDCLYAVRAIAKP